LPGVKSVYLGNKAMAQSQYGLRYPDLHVVGSYVSQYQSHNCRKHVVGSYVSQYQSHNYRKHTQTETNSSKMYFACVGTLSQRPINNTGNTTSSVLNASDNITDIQIFPLKNKYAAAERFLINVSQVS
jgi:hypothetical protein